MQLNLGKIASKLKRNSVRIFMIVFGVWSILTTTMKNPYYFEIDSYVLPIVSLQHRGSIIIEQQDIDQAKIDFPDLYFGINNYDDLRLSKLNKIDNDHWISFYFPVYAMVCLPVKLLLNLFYLNQQQAFTMTNAIVLLIALYYLIKNYRENEHEGLLCAIMMLCSPIWYYIQYIGAEPVMFSSAIFAYLLWRKKKYKTAALIISITSMTNPAFMGIGIVMFLEYLFSSYRRERHFCKNKSWWKETLKVCACYIPSLMPFAFNLVTIGMLNPTVQEMFDGCFDPVWRRFLAYIFDLNLGIASISVLILILFFAAIVYSIVKKKTIMIFSWISVLFTMFAFSFMPHINCGMYMCARYVLWIYPGVVFTICDFLFDVCKKDRRISKLSIVFCCASYIFFYGINGNYDFADFNNISKFILNHNPSAYVNCCDSTFNTRANHRYDGGYKLDTISIYTDSETEEVRKILVYNSAETRKKLFNILVSKQDNNFDYLKQELDKKKSNELCYVNIGRNSEIQYTLKFTTKLYDWMENFFYECDIKTDTDTFVDIVNGYIARDESMYKQIYEMISFKDASREDFVHKLFIAAYSNDQLDILEDRWLKSDMNNYEMMKALLDSDSFRAQFGFYTGEE